MKYVTMPAVKLDILAIAGQYFMHGFL